MRQQLDSFDEFIQMSVQRIVEDSPAIELQAESQYDDREAPVPWTCALLACYNSVCVRVADETYWREKQTFFVCCVVEFSVEWCTLMHKPDIIDTCIHAHVHGSSTTPRYQWCDEIILCSTHFSCSPSTH